MYMPLCTRLLIGQACQVGVLRDKYLMGFELCRLQEMAGTVGPPLPCTAFKLEAVPEMKYDPGEPQVF